MAFYRNRVFPLLAGLLWAVFLTLDLTGLGDSTWVKYAALCLCCGTALTGMRTADGRLVAAALCLTLCADWFLLVRNDHYELGIGIFIAVQLIYAVRLCLLREKRICYAGLLLRLLCVLLSGLPYYFLFDGWWEGPPRTTLSHDLGSLFSAWLSLLYFSNLVINTAEAFSLGPKARRFAWGLFLFVCCDLCVGACNRGILTVFTWWGSWLFYLPSKVLIVLSQEPEKGDPDEKRF